MKAHDTQGLRAIFRHMLVVVAASTGACGATVVAVPPGGPSDSGTTDDAALRGDATPTDRNACDPIRVIPDPSAGCPSETVTYPCGLPPELLLDDGGTTTDNAVCNRLCSVHRDGVPTICSVPTDPAAPNTLRCQVPCVGGRRPEGWCDRADEGPEGVGAWFSRLASLEAASVFAFERMAVELTLHGAPAELVDLAREAIDDERRHTALTADLARAWGCAAQLPASAPMLPRSLDAVALDNAIEGCVRETYGALVASWQAEHARDARIASALRVIADDETRHAWLSWSTHAWLRGRLSDSDRDALDRAMREALSELRAAVDVDVSDDLVRTLGVPTRAQQCALVDALASQMRT
jgi:hypothetical protein